MLTVKRVLRYEHIKLWSKTCVIRHRTTFKDKTQICERSSNALRCEKQRLLREKVSQKYPLLYNSSDVYGKLSFSWVHLWWQRKFYLQKFSQKVLGKCHLKYTNTRGWVASSPVTTREVRSWGYRATYLDCWALETILRHTGAGVGI